MADALVLAAGETHGRLAQATGTRFRALINVGGVSIVERVVAALREARMTQRIVVIAPPEVRERVPAGVAELTVPSGDNLLGNVLRGLDALDGVGTVLFAHADAPLITADSIDDFLQRAEPLRPDLAYAIVPREDVERRFPRGHRTYARLRDGTFTGTNIVLVDGGFIRRHEKLIREFYEHRKNPLRLAGMLGAGFVLRLLAGRLTIADLERRVGQVIGGEARGIISHYPELAFDVDKVGDLESIRELLGD